MENKDIMEMLKTINVLLKNKSYIETQEYVQLEIENLQGITPKKCKSTFYFYDYCKYCSIEKCPNNILKRNNN